jgi:hypothetical protein
MVTRRGATCHLVTVPECSCRLRGSTSSSACHDRCFGNLGSAPSNLWSSLRASTRLAPGGGTGEALAPPPRLRPPRGPQGVGGSPRLPAPRLRVRHLATGGGVAFSAHPRGRVGNSNATAAVATSPPSPRGCAPRHTCVPVASHTSHQYGWSSNTTPHTAPTLLRDTKSPGGPTTTPGGCAKAGSRRRAQKSSHSTSAPVVSPNGSPSGQ